MMKTAPGQFYAALLFATACCTAFGAQPANDVDDEDLGKCVSLAKELNQTKRLGIRLDGLERLVTWRAACAERPPTGPGNVTVLCQGKYADEKGEKAIFFWQKSKDGKLNNGYFSCNG